MKQTLNFAKRNLKEIVRDPVSIIFALFLPLFLLIIFQQFKIPSDIYKIENFTPAIVIFSYSFITLFTATLVASDRSSSLLSRLFSSPMTSREFIFGYALSVVPVVFVQCILFYATALIMGLPWSINVIYSVLVSIPLSFLFILLGIMIGCFTSAKSASGVGSVVVQLVAFTSGMYFTSEMVGKGFDFICKLLPFKSTLDILKDTLNGTNTNFLIHAIIFICYLLIISSVTMVLFNQKMQSDNK